MTDVLTRIRIDCLEQCLKEVLRQLLNREPLNEDAKRLTMVYMPDRFAHPDILDWCILLLDGSEIGRLDTFYKGISITTTFTPKS